MKALSQNDPRWAKQILGFNAIESIYTIGGYGCTITCLAMVAGTDPLTLNNQLKTVGGFVNGGYYVWQSINQLYNINESQVQLSSHVERIKAEIRAGRVCILRTAYNNQMHYVLAHQLDGEHVMIIDPMDGVVKYLGNSYRTFTSYTSYLTIDSNNNNNQDMELKNKMKEIITTDSRYDEETRRMLLAAVDNGDMGYVLAFSGAYIRDELKNQQYKQGELQIAYDNLVEISSRPTFENYVAQQLPEAQPAVIEEVQNNEGRPFGISKKLIVGLLSALGVPTTYLSLVEFLPEQVVIDPNMMTQYALPVLGMITIISCVYIISQAIIDYKNK